MKAGRRIPLRHAAGAGFFLLVAMLAAAAPAARAQGAADTSAAGATPAPADTSLGRYLDTLRDSSNTIFRAMVTPVDTAGLDSVLAVRLAHPGKERYAPAGAWRPALSPWLGFNRVDGPVYGGAVAIGRRRSLGVLGGRAGYGVASDTWLGAGEYSKSLATGPLAWRFDAEAGRLTAGIDRERSDLRLGALRAFLTGNDTRRYLRHDGFSTELAVEHPVWRGSVGYRDMLESPLDVHARWSLLSSSLAVSDNLAAVKGHAHELGYTLGARTPWLPFTAEAEYATSSDGIGSDFEYRRYRLGLGGDIGLGRSWVLVPQFAYGRLTGDALPQESFYLGGSRTLRSIEGDAIGGTGMTLARLDLLELPDVLELLHVPHPALLPLQVGAFVATGAVWGVDPYGGPTRRGVDLPEEQEFRHEVGASLMYRPGLPDPNTYVQLGWAWPIGPHSGPPRFSLSYSRGIDLVKPFGRD